MLMNVFPTLASMETVLMGPISSHVLVRRVILETPVMKKLTSAVFNSPVAMDYAHLGSTLTPVSVILDILG